MDKKNTQEVIYLFTEEFKYIDKFLAQKFKGHPKKNKVYRAILDDSGVFVIKFEDSPLGLILSAFEDKDEESPWNYKFKIINEDNVEEIPVSQQKKILKWSEENSDKFIEENSPKFDDKYLDSEELIIDDIEDVDDLLNQLETRIKVNDEKIDYNYVVNKLKKEVPEISRGLDNFFSVLVAIANDLREPLVSAKGLVECKNSKYITANDIVRNINRVLESNDNEVRTASLVNIVLAGLRELGNDKL